jgi:hypothetical protein
MTVVREKILAGPCLRLGELIRETDKLYFYHHPWYGERHVPKRPRGYPRFHIEPCRRCEDHPETDYPNGHQD